MKNSLRQTAVKVPGLPLHFMRSSRCVSLALLVAGGHTVCSHFFIAPFLLLPPGQMEMLLFVLGQDNLLHVFFPLRYVERVCVSFFCGCKHFKITVVKNNYGCFLA